MRTHLTVVPREDEMFDITDEGKVIYTVSYDRDSRSFWGSSVTGQGQQSFETLQEVTDYVTKHRDVIEDVHAADLAFHERENARSADVLARHKAGQAANVIEALLK